MSKGLLLRSHCYNMYSCPGEFTDKYVCSIWVCGNFWMLANEANSFSIRDGEGSNVLPFSVSFIYLNNLIFSYIKDLYRGFSSENSLYLIKSSRSIAAIIKGIHNSAKGKQI